MTMEKKRSRISWKKELDHEVGEELKEKRMEECIHLHGKKEELNVNG